MATKTSSTFTARETELLTLAFQCFKEKPNIDYELMASKAGLKGAKSARDSFGPLYNKIVSGEKSSGSHGEGKEPGDELSPKKKGTPSKRKAAGTDGGGDDDETSPIKKKKATPKKGKKKPVADEEDAEDTIVVKAEVVDQDGEEDHMVDGVAGQDV